MRWLAIVGYLGLVVAVAYWAYSENYTTQASSRRVDDLRKQIAQERAAISVLNAEWAYLNRPERLENLVDLNFERLQLVPMAAQHFAKMQELPKPFNFNLEEVNPIEVSSQDDEARP